MLRNLSRAVLARSGAIGRTSHLCPRPVLARISQFTTAAYNRHASEAPSTGNDTTSRPKNASKIFPPLSQAEDFLSGSAANYIAEMYSAWLHDPKSVHISWQVYFRNILAAEPGSPFIPPPTITGSASTSTTSATLSHFSLPAKLKGAATTPLQLSLDEVIGDAILEPENFPKVPASEVMDHMKVQLMVRAYQVRGHQLANLDPLGISHTDASEAPELDYRFYGFTEADLKRPFFLGLGILPWFLQNENKKNLTLQEIIDRLQRTYCGSIGVEYSHIPDRRQCDWLRQRFEVPTPYKYTKEEKQVILDRLSWAHSFERFVAAKYPSEKRFGLEGCETLIPGMKAMIDHSVELGVETIVMGMPHRGRLNVLCNVVRKPLESIFTEFSHSAESTVEGSGDVKYHLGMNFDRPTPSGKRVHLSLAANPSHLEAVNPVVQGKVRATQFYDNDEVERKKSMAVLLHGDAAFAGQGIVYETLGMSDLPFYTTGGSIHIIVNNQIGFTTDPRFSRSTPYCSDVAKTVSAPIFHVNGDDTEAVVYCMELASEWRAKFKKDVVLDIVCYRKHGHNETDQPQFTQPRMYKRIAEMKPTFDLYVKQLVAEGTFTEAEIKVIQDRIWNTLEEKYKQSKDYVPSNTDWVSSTWEGFKSPQELAESTVQPHFSGIELELLRHIGIAASSYPKDFTVHPNLARILRTREKTLKDGDGIDWATAESMSFGTLLAEGNHVRLSGQDVERGTFSQRHAVLHDQQREALYVPLNHLVSSGAVKSAAPITVCNSSLSEFGILGFELGYSMIDPNQLVLWEAQFGDFANTAQPIIDQFIAGGEQKWLQRTGITLLLPHGYDGQGPEHSSARLERFLQLVDEDPYTMPPTDRMDKRSYARQHQDVNMQVVYPSVPSNYFHVLRRQVHRDFRKPLIVLASKALLRHPLAKSALAEMGPQTRFQRLIPEVLHPNPLEGMVVGRPPNQEDSEVLWSGNNAEPRIPYALQKTTDGFSLAPPNEVKTLIFCTGQVYYLLYRARAMNKLRDVAIVRLEQITPFPFWEVKRVVDMYSKKLEEVVWCQEEAMNSGAWSFVEPRLETAIAKSKWWENGGASKALERLHATRAPGGLANANDHHGNVEESTSIRGSHVIRYAGRDPAAAPATGFKTQHDFEERMLVSEALMKGKLLKPKGIVDKKLWGDEFLENLSWPNTDIKTPMLSVLMKKMAADIDTVFSNQIVGMLSLLKEHVVEVVGEEGEQAVAEIEAWVDEFSEDDLPNPPPPVQVFYEVYRLLPAPYRWSIVPHTSFGDGYVTMSEECLFDLLFVP
ncbi:oxoglutarate dehydrogenase (succinyl-transferring) [Synchytrium endobioticum]|uniref:2-oxoglutarate dehydrogenase, mitochondrial n=1 Tax=Synchytrium endobioticum TaxID=286115 RepID=A0A507DEI8_9FUNG|nr:oxoglutarate dehydrogenase (succinyl-transferring) [Synchytrium endobioticum]TPX49278.1 oxoglutarate dehydrogenase (succinyl-transferring) [Synchytrium endobioticum]